MYRKEYDQTISILSGMRYPARPLGGSDLLKIASQLEKKYPDQILAFYTSGLGNLNHSCQRETYAHKAKVAQKVRHMWVDVLKTPAKWEAFAKQIKADNLRRPAFQEEFTKEVPSWRNV
ncbi:MAG: hypothetical protein HQ567_12590 [Candidatus Nealsonbacteria bacterium]|nr:hypothetical protein [Candidatus Nealsonbacteria bacterium]